MRLINADALESEVLYEEDYDYDYYENPIENYQPVEVVRLSEIKNAPTVDAVQVVRCKNCVHYSLHDAAGGRYCEILWNESPIESGYCCYGERRSE